MSNERTTYYELAKEYELLTSEEARLKFVQEKVEEEHYVVFLKARVEATKNATLKEQLTKQIENLEKTEKKQKSLLKAKAELDKLKEDIKNGKAEGTSGQNVKLDENNILAEIEKITTAIAGIANIDIDVKGPYMKLECIAQTVKELAERPREGHSKRMNDNLPKFSGKMNEDINTWIFRMDANMDLNCIHGEQRVLAVEQILNRLCTTCIHKI